MPVRLLRPAILTSEPVNSLDAAAEVFYRRLMSVVDDYGLYDARERILRTTLYSLRIDQVREADIARWLTACEKAGLIIVYTVDDRKYLQLLKLGGHPRSSPQFPPPPSLCKQLRADAAQMRPSSSASAGSDASTGSGSKSGLKSARAPSGGDEDKATKAAKRLESKR